MRRFFIIERPMSFYFKLETTVPLDPNKVLTFLDNKKVSFRQDDPGTTVFYMPGGSLRGVNVYDEPNGLSIGINAFTTRFDALLTRDITIALAKLHACTVQPEDLETPLQANEILGYCDDDWIAARQRESHFVFSANPASDGDDPVIVFGYARPFAVNKALIATYQTEATDTDDALGLIMEDAQILQEIDQKEDIFVPQIMEIAENKTNAKRGLMHLFSTLTSPKRSEVRTGFVLTEGVRTLTPVIAAKGPIYAILGSDTMPYHLVPMSMLEDAARALRAREFCVGAFDLTLSGQAYLDLYDKGRPI